jgi:predicted metal-dependent hydrolase
MEMTYDLVRSKKRKNTISLQVKKDGSIVIHAPYFTPKWEIDRFFKKKNNWLLRKIRERRVSRYVNTPKVFLSGENFLFLGVTYPLKIEDEYNGEDPLTFTAGQFIMEREKVSCGKELFKVWYKTTAKGFIEKRVNHYSKILNLYPTRLRISDAKFRWGSCSHDNRLSFSWRLIMAPGNVIDYVVVHELAHIREKNHSRTFWDFLAGVVSDYRTPRLWLKENGHLLDI